jgi:capsular polysaccharide transport system ATP-binding protein
MILCENVTKSYPMGSGRKKVLQGIDMQIRPGEHLGFLGRNGAGKTTLIKLIGGVEMPTSGKIKRNMSVSWPLGFGGGFQGSLTGYDNARFIARIYGHEYSEIKDFVEDFTELGRQLKMPVKTYSSGMRARLAFALSLAIEFDCYLIDEVIMVGALVLASHSPELIREFCDRALVLHQGLATIYSDVDKALEVYEGL